MNNWTIAGRLGRDAETKTVGEHLATSFAVAVDRRVKGEKVTDWIDCTLWGERGEKVGPYITKGSTISVSGEAGTRSYEKDGNTVIVMTMRVNQVTLLGKGSERTDQAPKPAPRREPAPAKTNDFADDFADDDIPF